MQPVTSEVLFGVKSHDFGVRKESDDVKEAVLETKREADGKGESLGFREDVEEDLEGSVGGVGRKELVLATIAGEGEFGEAEEGDLFFFCLSDDGEDARLVSIPVEWGLVERAGGKMDVSHG